MYLWGADGSPYSCKVRALMRYRRIPFLWKPVCDAGQFDGSLFERFGGIPKVIPVLEFGDGTYMNDSTPIIAELESKFTSRSVIPKDDALSFFAALIEDFADEWFTKVMFEGRFHTESNAVFGASWQTFQNVDMCATDGMEEVAADFARRQVKRRSLVGCTNWEMMERTLRLVCEILTDNLKSGHMFLFGSLPSNADFALFGQLRQLSADPLPAKIVHEFPHVWGWVWRLDDLSGYESAEGEYCMTSGALAMLALIGQTYAPFLLANSRALENGELSVSVTIFGSNHSQPSFKYQNKCLMELRWQYESMQDKTEARSVLQRTNLLDTFATRSRF